MLEEPVLRKLLPVPYVPRPWQLKGLRWWVNWRKAVLAFTAVLAYAAINPYLMAWLESLPVLAQQAVGLLFLAAMLGFSVWYAWRTRHPFGIFLAAGYTAVALTIAGVWPAVTVPLIWVFLAAAFLSLFAGPVRQFVQDRRPA